MADYQWAKGISILWLSDEDCIVDVDPLDELLTLPFAQVACAQVGGSVSKKLTILGDYFTNENYRISLSSMKTRIIHCACKMQASNSLEILEHNLFPYFLFIRIHEL